MSYTYIKSSVHILSALFVLTRLEEGSTTKAFMEGCLVKCNFSPKRLASVQMAEVF